MGVEETDDSGPDTMTSPVQDNISDKLSEADSPTVTTESSSPSSSPVKINEDALLKVIDGPSNVDAQLEKEPSESRGSVIASDDDDDSEEVSLVKSKPAASSGLTDDDSDDDDSIVRKRKKPAMKNGPSSGLSDDEEGSNDVIANADHVRGGPSTGLTDSESESEDDADAKPVAKVMDVVYRG